jgi:hypothetical protein
MLIVDSSNEATGNLSRFLLIRRSSRSRAHEIFICRLDIPPIDPQS